MGRDLLNTKTILHLYHYSYNKPIYIVDYLGNAPLYEPDKWNTNVNYQNANNCYSYALDIRFELSKVPFDMHDSENNFRLQPGQISKSKRKLKKFGCNSVTSLVKEDGLYKADKENKCKCNDNIIALIVGPNDYHWYRKDNNGLWSHKPGIKAVTNLDEEGKIISDPEKAKWNKTYKRFCGYFCVPSEAEFKDKIIKKFQKSNEK